MKKSNLARRVLCAMLGILMLASVLTACDNSYVSTSTEAAKAVTVTLTMIKEDGMTQEGILRIQDALNEITENRYNTHVVLQMYTASEYQAKVLEMSQKLDINDAGQEGSSYVSSEIVLEDGQTYKQVANGDYYLVDEANRSHAIYPTLINTQLDVLFIDSVETYTLLAKGAGDRSFLADHSTIIGSSDLPVTKYINSTLLSYAKKVNGQFRAIPNNYYYGEYSYMLVNKEYFSDFDYDISLVKNFGDLESFIYDIANSEEHSNVTPVYNFNGFKFLSYFDFETPLLLQASTSYSKDAVLNDMTRMSYYQASMNMLYNLSKLTDRTYKDTNEVDFSADFAVAFMDGDYTIPEKYADPDGDGTDDYHVINLVRPTVENEMFESMLAVSEFSANKERAFQILALLQADVDVVNLLAYGIRGEDYELINGVVEYKEGSNYVMDYRKVGNTFLCLPNDKMDAETAAYAADDWKLAKKHNEKLVISPFCGFYVQDNKLEDYVYYDAENPDSGIKFVETADKTGVMLVDKKGNLVKEKGLTKIYLYNNVMLKQFEEYCATFVPRMTDFEAAAEYETYKDYLKALSKEFQESEIYSQVTGTNTATNNTYANSLSPRAQFQLFSGTTNG